MAKPKRSQPADSPTLEQAPFAVRAKDDAVTLAWQLRALTTRLTAGEDHAPSALYNVIFSARDTFADYWDGLAEFIAVAAPRVDFAQPIHIRPGVAHEFGSLEAFYAEMIEPWAGPIDKLMDRLRRFKAGQITQAQGAAETRTAAERSRAAAEATTGEVLRGGSRPRTSTPLSTSGGPRPDQQNVPAEQWIETDDDQVLARYLCDRFGSQRCATVAGWWYHWWAGAPAPEPPAAPWPPGVAAPEAPAEQREASDDDPDRELRQRLADQLAEHAGDTSMESVAARIGIHVSTLKTFLGGARIYPKARAAIEAYLA
jgi:hypothetical protein